MEKNKIELVETPEEIGEKDSLTELLRVGAKALISQAVEAELEEMLSLHSSKLYQLQQLTQCYRIVF
jgi:hypothetical protein